MALALAVIGTGLSAIGSIAAGQAKQQAADYQAAVANNNARYARQVGQVDAENQKVSTGQVIGAQKAAQAANGVDIGSGSALDVRTSAAELGELDALTIRNNAENKAKNYEAQATLFQMEGKADALSGWLGAASSIVGGASNIADKWSIWKTQGLVG